MGGIMIKILICEDIERDKLHLHQSYMIFC